MHSPRVCPSSLRGGIKSDPSDINESRNFIHRCEIQMPVLHLSPAFWCGSLWVLLCDPLWLLLLRTSLSPLTFQTPTDQCSVIAKNEHLNSPRRQIWGVIHATPTNSKHLIIMLSGLSPGPATIYGYWSWLDAFIKHSSNDSMLNYLKYTGGLRHSKLHQHPSQRDKELWTSQECC